MDSIQRIDIERQAIRSSFPLFALSLRGKEFFTPFHLTYYKVLNAFAHGRIKRLIITIPPQHGKSEGSTRLLPAYMLGLNPDITIAIASYNASLASRFNAHSQRIIDSKEYRQMFPNTCIKGADNPNANYVRTNNRVEIINHSGELMSVGREGPLTGNRVDIMIMDDLYKDAMEANSPTIRENCWEWYTSTVKTRLHNKSQELIVFTRWHEEDLIGTIERKEKVIELTSLSQIDQSADCWYKLNFEAIKESDPTPIDPRQHGEALWSELHSAKLLKEKRALDRLRFDCMYQGRPESKEGLLYGDNFKTYTSLPEDTLRNANYTDTADTGDDYLCSICYLVGKDGLIYVTDILYTKEPMEVTEPATAQMLERNQTRQVNIESNNGGRGFARNVGRLYSKSAINWFHQSANKESRISTNSATVIKHIIMPADWKIRWSEFYLSITGYKRLFRANRNDDAADVLTGIVETEVFGKNKKIQAIGFSN